MKRWIVLCLVCALVCSGCTMLSEEEKIKDLEFSVVPLEDVPEDIGMQIEEKKEAPFWFTYSDGAWKFMIVGYGAQETGGYSIVVDAVYETENTIVVKTTLIGPETVDAALKVTSYPYIVLKIENMDKTVVFE